MKPDMRPLGPNIADKGSRVYHFSATSFDSVDGTRHYRVWTAVPNTTAPASGYPILYMLDGNAVMRTARMTNCSNNCQKNTASDRGCRVSDQPPFRSNSRGLRPYASSRKQKTDLHQGVLAVRVVAATTSASYRNAYCPQKVEQGLNIDRQRPRVMGALLAASSCWDSGCPPLTSVVPAPARRWAEVMMFARVTAVEPLQFYKHRR